MLPKFHFLTWVVVTGCSPYNNLLSYEFWCDFGFCVLFYHNKFLKQASTMRRVPIRCSLSPPSPCFLHFSPSLPHQAPPGLRELEPQALLSFSRRKFLPALIICVVFLFLPCVSVSLAMRWSHECRAPERSEGKQVAGGAATARGQAECRHHCATADLQPAAYVAPVCGLPGCHPGLELARCPKALSQHRCSPQTFVFPSFSLWKEERTDFPHRMPVNTPSLDRSPCFPQPGFKSPQLCSSLAV